MASWKLERVLKFSSKDTNIILIGAKGEEDFLSLLNLIIKYYRFSRKNNNFRWLVLLKKSKALIVTDTGTAHIASAVNTAVFVWLDQLQQNKLDHTKHLLTKFIL